MLRESPSPVEISISPEKVCYIIVKAREFDVKVEPVEPNPANPSDDASGEILESYSNDPTFQELQEAVVDLNDDEVVDLIAIAWVGRGDFDRTDFAGARGLALERTGPIPPPTSSAFPTLATASRKDWRISAIPVTRPHWRTCSGKRARPPC